MSQIIDIETKQPMPEPVAYDPIEGTKQNIAYYQSQADHFIKMVEKQKKVLAFIQETPGMIEFLTENHQE